MYAVGFSFKDHKINLCCTQLFCLGTKWGRTLRIETKNGSVGEIRESRLPVLSHANFNSAGSLSGVAANKIHFYPFCFRFSHISI